MGKGLKYNFTFSKTSMFENISIPFTLLRCNSTLEITRLKFCYQMKAIKDLSYQPLKVEVFPVSSKEEDNDLILQFERPKQLINHLSSRGRFTKL